MSNDAALAEFDIRDGSRLTLYASRLVQQGDNAMEAIPLSHLASVRVLFARDTAKLVWGVVLLIFTLALAFTYAPLQRSIAAAVAKFGDPARPESLDTLLLGIFNIFGAVASLLPALATALAAGAIALFVYYGLGTTTLTLAFGGTERAFAVRGRNHALVLFAEAIADRLAGRGQ